MKKTKISKRFRLTAMRVGFLFLAIGILGMYQNLSDGLSIAYVISVILLFIGFALIVVMLLLPENKVKKEGG